MSKLKTQFGEALTADFEENTWTFEMKGEFKVSAGDFAIVPKENYDKLYQILQRISAIENEAFGLKSFNVERLKKDIDDALSVVF